MIRSLSFFNNDINMVKNKKRTYNAGMHYEHEPSGLLKMIFGQEHCPSQKFLLEDAQEMSNFQLLLPYELII